MDQRVLGMEHQIIDLKAEVVRYQDSEMAANREIETLR